jgi:hypothetical protein
MGFSSYSMYYPMVQTSVASPAVQSQYYPSYTGSPYGGGYMQQPAYGGYPPPYGQQPSGDDTSGVTALMGQLMSLFMSLFQGQGSSVPTGEDPFPPEDGGTEEPTPEDPRLQEIQGLNPDTNTDALQILSAYGNDLGAVNGKLDQNSLKKVAGLDVPDEVKQAAQNMVDNPELYNLLCLKSHNSPHEGFRLSVLDDDWDGKVDIDNLESYSDAKDAVEELKSSGKLDSIAALSGSADDISQDDLEKVALGTAGSQFKDPELQAAALQLLSDTDSWSSLDTINKDDANKYDQAEDDSFDKAAIDKWLSVN